VPRFDNFQKVVKSKLVPRFDNFQKVVKSILWCPDLTTFKKLSNLEQLYLKSILLSTF